MNKLCDAADWFRPEIDRIIREELEDTPRFHRKQWEFAVIYRVLEENGLLNGATAGISFGSGTELMLYAVARRVQRIWATDLYTADSAWDIARTEDPMDLIRRRAPFPFQEGSIAAKNMDMRQIEFPDEAFDFAYSSCAIEHIGEKADFIRHLHEVKRVLKPGGVYVFTTELNYADLPVELVGNFFFSRQLLEDIVRESGMESESEFDASLWRSRINTPLPLELHYGLNDGEGRLNEKLFGTLCHVQLLAANLALTSCIVVLRKTGRSFKKWEFTSWDATRRFIDLGIDLMRSMIEESEFALHPFAWLPNRQSSYYIGHADYFQADLADDAGGTLFHSPFVWLGRRSRTIRVAIHLESKGVKRLLLSVYRRSTFTPAVIEVEISIELEGPDVEFRRDIEVHAQDECTYAVLAQVMSGDVALKDVTIKCMPSLGISA